MIWKYFKNREIVEAKKFAAEGNIAIHQNNVKYKNRETCHMLAKDMEILIEAGKELGMKTCWIHHGHYDLFGVPLEKALKKCQ